MIGSSSRPTTLQFDLIAQRRRRHRVGASY
jgi:hypothetical protein